MFDHFISRLFRFYHTLWGRITIFLMGIALAYGLVALQAIPVHATAGAATVDCGFQSSYTTYTAEVSKSFTCNADGGGTDENPTHIWTEHGVQTEAPNAAVIRCRNWDASFDQTVQLEAGTHLGCLVQG